MIVAVTLPVLLLAGTAAAPPQALRHATFDVRHELKVKIPEGAKKVRAWFTVPRDDDDAQKVTDFQVTSPVPYKIVKDSEGNREIYVELANSTTKELTIATSFVLDRSEVRSGVDAAKTHPYTKADLAGKERYLVANTHVIIDDRIKKLAGEIVGEEKNPVVRARKIYDWTLANIDYWVKDPKNKKASPVGSTEYCLTSRTGNCTDFHSLWTSLARAASIPTRMVYGSFLKAELDGQETDQSYHCWPEFWAPGIGWVPHDVAVADIYAGDFETNTDNEVLVRRTTGDGYRGKDLAKIDYYFGNLDERRVTWSVGRDLTLSPKQDAGPVNAMAKAYVEIDGVPAPDKEGWVRTLTFRERKKDK